MKGKHEENEQAKKLEVTKALKLRKEGIYKYQPKEKAQTMGHFL